MQMFIITVRRENAVSYTHLDVYKRQPDGQELPKLIENAKENGIKVTEVIGCLLYTSRCV